MKHVGLLVAAVLPSVASLPKVYEGILHALESSPSVCNKLGDTGTCYTCNNNDDCALATGDTGAQCWACGDDGTTWIDRTPYTCSTCSTPPSPPIVCTIPAGQSIGAQADDLESEHKWPESKKVFTYWMPPYNMPQWEIPPADLIKRSTHIVLAFAATYHMAPPDYVKPVCHDTCTLDLGFDVADPSKLSDFTNRMKAINANVRVSVSFGGWNQGPGGDVNCYSQSNCYSTAGVTLLAQQLNALPCIDGIDLDYEMTADLAMPNGAGISFLQSLTNELKKDREELEITHAPMPPYMAGGCEAFNDPACESYSKGVLASDTTVANIDHLLIQYYNNQGYAVSDSDRIASQIKATAAQMKGGSKAVVGLCYTDCNEGYSAPTYTDDGKLSLDQSAVTTLMSKVAEQQPDYGGIMLWTNPKSTKDANCNGCANGGVMDIANWLDMIKPSP